MRAKKKLQYLQENFAKKMQKLVTKFEKQRKILKPLNANYLHLTVNLKTYKPSVERQVIGVGRCSDLGGATFFLNNKNVISLKTVYNTAMKFIT